MEFDVFEYFKGYHELDNTYGFFGTPTEGKTRRIYASDDAEGLCSYIIEELDYNRFSFTIPKVGSRDDWDEIVQQVVLVSGKVNRIVFMGMGEPLFNYDNVIKAIHILRDRKGLNFPTDGITISTSGPLPQMKKIREEHLKIQLTLSLHATNQRTRNYIMPHMKGYDIEEVVQSTLSYSERHNRTVTIAYLLIPGLNDRLSDVKQLGRWFRGKNVLINLLQYNETDCKVVRRPNKQELVAFRDKLNDVGLTVKIRESRGGSIKAACGQLVSKLNRRTDSSNVSKKTSGSTKKNSSCSSRDNSSRNKTSKMRERRKD